jgi:membrane protein
MWARTSDFLDRLFFGPTSQRRDPLAITLAITLAFLRYPYAVLRDLARGEINLRAMGLVYATLLTTVPLLAFSFAILKGFGPHRALKPVIFEFFKPLGDRADELTTRVMQFADSVSSGLLGSIGLALLLWTLVGTVKKLEDSFNFLWRVEVSRGFARRVVEYVALVILAPILLVAFIGLSRIAERSAPVKLFTQYAFGEWVLSVGLWLAPYIAVTAVFTVLYMFVPNTRVRLVPALIGALAAGVVWAAVGNLFTALVVYSTRLAIVYAGFAIFVAALVWIYFSWLILLVGAQLSFYVQNPTYLRLGLEHLHLSGVELERLTLKIMYLIGRDHTAGQVHWTTESLAVALGLPGIAVATAVRGLERAQLLVATGAGQLIPARDVGHIELAQIIEVARNQHSGYVAANPLELPTVARLNAQIDQAIRGCCAQRTLRNLLDEPA